MERRIPDCSVVIPVFFNEGCLRKTMATLLAEVVEPRSTLRWEVIFVDDGSQDGSLEELLAIRDSHREIVKVVKLTKNFGQVYAILAGLEQSTGRFTAIMSADGQDPPAIINQLLDKHLHDEVDIAIATRRNRDESWYRRGTSALFYFMMRKLSFPEMPQGGFDFFSLSRKAVCFLLAHTEAHGFLQGQVLSSGYKVGIVEYDRQRRDTGVSRWTFWRKVSYLLDGVLGYSFLPIRLMSLIGCAMAVLGLVYAVVIIAARIFGAVPFTGWAPIMIVILTMGGFQLLTLGIVGEYVWRALAQVRSRPLYVVDRIYEQGTTGTIPPPASF